MRSLNVRLAVILLTVIVVGGVGIFFLHYFMQKKHADVFLEQAEVAKLDAEKAKKEKNTTAENEAIDKQLKNLGWYLSFNPKDMDVMETYSLLLADHIVDEQSLNQAISWLEQVVREDETRYKSRQKLVELLIGVGRNTDAKEYLSFLIKEAESKGYTKPKESDDKGDSETTAAEDKAENKANTEPMPLPKLLELLGRCQEAQDEFENAQKTYEKAIEYAPKQIITYMRLANLLDKHLEKPKEAYAYIKKMVENNPKSATAYIYLGEYFQIMASKEEAKKATEDDIDPKEEAMKAAEKALELSPDNADALMLAAKTAIALGDMEKARSFLERNMAKHKDFPAPYIMLADITTRSKEKDFNKAVEILDEGLKQTKNSPQILWTKVNILINNQDLKAAKEGLAKLEKLAYPKSQIEYLAARIVFAEKDWAQAAKLFEAVRPALSKNPDSFAINLIMQTDLCLGDCYGQLHNGDQQVRAYKRVLSLDPDNIYARQGLTNAMLASGQVDDAVREYYLLIQTKKIPPSGLITFAGLLIRQKKQQNANEKQWGDVEKILDEADKANPDAYQIPLLRAEVYHSQDRNAEAEKVLQKALDKNPKQHEFWSAMVTILAAQEKWDQVDKILADFQKQVGDCVDVRLAQAEYALRRYNNKAGEHLNKLGDNIDGFSDADKIKLWNGLLNAARRTGDQTLINIFTTLLSQKDTSNLEVHFLRAEQAANSQDLAALEAALKDVEKVEGKGPLWLFGQARLLAIKASKENNLSLLDDAMAKLEQAQELRPSWPRIPLFMGTIYDQRQKTDLALKMYLKAIEQGERSPAAMRRTVQLLSAQQRYSEADKLLRQMDKMEVPITPELMHLWVQLLIQQGEFDSAVAKARQAVSEKSDDYGEHLWLGRILSVAARRAKAQKNKKQADEFVAEAEKSLRRAIELKSDIAETWVALVEFLGSVDKTGDAMEAISQAQRKIPADKAPLALAQCYEVIEKNDKALEQYTLALAATPDDPAVIRSVVNFYQQIGKTTEAEAQLQRIIDEKVKVDDANMAWARRQMAVIIAAKGGMKNMEMARALIEKNLAASQNSTDDLRLKAKLDAFDPRRSRQDEAVEILSNMLKGQQATPEDRFNLAMLYLSLEKQTNARIAHGESEENKDKSAWLQASTILRNLILSQENEPRYLAIYATALLEHGEISGAELYLNKLAKDFPNAAATIVLQAEILARRNQYEDALDLMKSFVDKKNATPSDRSTRIRMMAETMEKLSSKLAGPDQKSMAERYIKTAEMFYRQFVDEHPSQSLDLVAFFTRQGIFDEAVSFLEQNWQNSDAPTIAQIGMTIIQQPKCPKELAERVEKVLAEARTKFDNHPALLVTLGDLRVNQNRFPEAENFYREVLAKNPAHAVALNNLAVLLTLQGQKLDEALKLINQAIENTGPIGSMLDTRGCVYIAQGNAEKAISDMKECVAEAITPVRLFHLAQAINLSNQKYEAASTMQKALKAGLTKEMLNQAEIPAFEKLIQQAKELGTTE